jgi:hypothetical protein
MVKTLFEYLCQVKEASNITSIAACYKKADPDTEWAGWDTYANGHLGVLLFHKHYTVLLEVYCYNRYPSGVSVRTWKTLYSEQQQNPEDLMSPLVTCSPKKGAQWKWIFVGSEAIGEWFQQYQFLNQDLDDKIRGDVMNERLNEVLDGKLDEYPAASTDEMQHTYEELLNEYRTRHDASLKCLVCGKAMLL